MSQKMEFARKLMQQYHKQVLVGCGRVDCDNNDCASSGNLPPMSRTEAAAHALMLFSKQKHLCPALIIEGPTAKGSVEKVEESKAKDEMELTVQSKEDKHEKHKDPSTTMETDNPVCSIPSSTKCDQGVKIAFLDDDTMKMECGLDNKPTESSIKDTEKPLLITEKRSKTTILKEEARSELTEEKIKEMFVSCETTGDWTPMRKRLGVVFSSADLLNISFVNESSPQDPQAITVDLEAARRSLDLLFNSQHQCFYLPAVMNNIVNLCNHVEFDLQYQNAYEEKAHFLNLFVIVMELPVLHDLEFMKMAFLNICRMYLRLPLKAKAQLVRLWSTQGKSWLLNGVQTIQQAITVRIFDAHPNIRRPGLLAEDDLITSSVQLLHFFYCASILGGTTDPPLSVAISPQTDDVSGSMDVTTEESGVKRSGDLAALDAIEGASASAEPDGDKDLSECHVTDLEKELDINAWNVRKPLIALDDFYNETLCDYLDIESDYIAYKRRRSRGGERVGFGFLPTYSFVVTADVKMQFLFFENRIRMHGERRSAMAATFNSGIPVDPYLRLRVRREHVVRDALVNLGTVAANSPEDFHKQLRVEFEDEPGIDEGGVSKEFYQMITEELFNPDYGMFVYGDQSRLFWFNPGCIDCRSEYTLIGVLFGLAIYNSIILDVHFPMVLYRKLFNRPGRLADLEQLDPTLYKSLKSLLDYSEGDVEETFNFTFQISYTDVYGSQVTEDLKTGGEQIVVTKENRQEFVDLYVDFLLNRSVQSQFNAFLHGFRMVTDENILARLFVPEEIEELICGISDFDFASLERTTKYSHGYDENNQTIRNFWQVLHEMSMEEKKLLLQFTTGCDRVPLGGLSKLDFIIAKNGDDSERLPTAHTCFNVLLLPEYETKDKLKERLIKAITNSRGFGLH